VKREKQLILSRIYIFRKNSIKSCQINLVTDCELDWALKIREEAGNGVISDSLWAKYETKNDSTGKNSIKLDKVLW
jgi:hypothetical protein